MTGTTSQPSAKPTLTVAEARQVPWLRQNPRPLGELIDSGYLTPDRLEWAARNAYDPRLKAAAQTLLAAGIQTPATRVSADIPPFPTGLNRAQARATPWPFGATKGQPMGTLLDSQQLSMKDLVYAIENAWDLKVRQAAMALLAVRLGQIAQEPVSTAGPLQVVSAGRSYAQREQLRLSLLQGFIGGVILVALTWMFVGSLAPLFAQGYWQRFWQTVNSPLGIVLFAILAIASIVFVRVFFYLFDRGTRKIDMEIDLYHLGQEGEERVVDAIRYAVDGAWTLFKNVSLPGRNRGDIDLILVGPTQIFSIEVKAFTNQYKNVGDRWMYLSGKRWRRASKNPSRQAQSNAARLSNYLKANAITCWVEPVIVWANPANNIASDNPLVPIWTLNRLAEELNNTQPSRRLPDADRQRIVTCLTKLCNDLALESYQRT